jgi:hypothetical protein
MIEKKLTMMIVFQEMRSPTQVVVDRAIARMVRHRLCQVWLWLKNGLEREPPGI